MAAAATTALLRSVATKMARRLGSAPASSSSRRFSSSPAGASTPSSTNKKDAIRNKIDLMELERAKDTLIKVTTGVVKLIVFGNVIMLFGLKLEIEALMERLDALERNISNVENYEA